MVSSRPCLSLIFTDRCAATLSASLEASVICGMELSASGGTFLFSFT